jgi:predicted dehydrogenase
MSRRAITRRRFLSTTAASVGAATMISSIPRRVLGANDDLRIAVVGFNGRGSEHINAFSSIAGCRVTALCDADEKVLMGRAERLNKDHPGAKVETYQDIRKMLESKNVDAVVTATPNHWHSLVTVWSCQAGKDVYVEKPISHEIWEGRKCVDAMKK